MCIMFLQMIKLKIYHFFSEPPDISDDNFVSISHCKVLEILLSDDCCRVK